MVPIAWFAMPSLDSNVATARNSNFERERNDIYIYMETVTKAVPK